MRYTSQSLKNQFLIATPQLSDGVFKSSVTYICEHSQNGAMGIIINRPSNMAIRDVLNEIDEERTPLIDQFEQDPVLLGGPVGLERGFVLHKTAEDNRRWTSMIQVTSDIALTGSKDILEAMSVGEGPEKFLLSLGYAGWDAGQLEEELMDNAWITSPASADILFDMPFHLRADAAAAQLGIDLKTIAPQAGNA